MIVVTDDLMINWIHADMLTRKSVKEENFL